jgi:hypothetical protein
MITQFLQPYRIPIVLCLLFILVSLPFSGRKMGYTVDATASFQITKAIAETGTFFPDVAVKQGYLYSIVYLPFYHFGTLLQPCFPEQSRDWVHRKCMGYMNTVITGFTVALLSLVIRECKYSTATQVWLPLLYGFSTLAFCYARYDYNKCLAGLLLLWSFYAFIRFLNTRKTLCLLWGGVATALLAMLRLELSLIVLVYSWAILFTPSSVREKWARICLYNAPIFIAILLVFIYNHYYWSGEMSGGYATKFTFFEGIIGFLFSPGKNIWLFNPVLLLLPLTIRHFWTQDPHMARIWAGIVVLPFLVYSVWGNWWGGWGYGPRHLIPLLPLLILPLAPVLESREKQPVILLFMLSIAGVGVQLLGSMFDFNDILLHLQKAGIPESQWIWNPLCNAVYQHFHFFRYAQASQWDYGIIAFWQSVTISEFFFAVCLWGAFTYWCVYRLVQSLKTNNS